MKQNLTARQKDIYEFIRECIELAGMPPTVREICSRFGFKSNRTVQVYLEVLRKKGWIRRSGNRSRGLELCGIFRGTPVIGRISAGMPVMAEEHFEGMVPVKFEPGSASHFAVKVEGDSMEGAQIFDGDFCIVRSQSRAMSGEIVAAVIDGETTVKRLVEIGRNRWVLRPENPSYGDIQFNPEQFRICGVVVGVWREI